MVSKLTDGPLGCINTENRMAIDMRYAGTTLEGLIKTTYGDETTVDKLLYTVRFCSRGPCTLGTCESHIRATLNEGPYLRRLSLSLLSFFFYFPFGPIIFIQHFGLKLIDSA